MLQRLLAETGRSTKCRRLRRLRGGNTRIAEAAHDKRSVRIRRCNRYRKKGVIAINLKSGQEQNGKVIRTNGEGPLARRRKHYRRTTTCNGWARPLGSSCPEPSSIGRHPAWLECWRREGGRSFVHRMPLPLAAV